MCLPFAVLLYGLHKLVGYPDGVVGILVGDTVVRATGDVKCAAVAGVDQRPRLALLSLLTCNEVNYIRVIDVENRHLCSTSRLSTTLDSAGKLVESTHERYRT